MNKLLTSNTKIDKTLKLFPNYEASILQLLPSKHVCDNPYYKNCISNCLSFKGMSKVYPKTVIGGRKKRVDLLLSDTPSFMLKLEKEINNQIKRSLKKGKECCIRLNGFSDIDWNNEKYFIKGSVIFNYFYEVQFWDYTKNLERIKTNVFKNYSLTYSYIDATETQPSNIKESLEALRLGYNVAVIQKEKDSWEVQLLKDKCSSFTDGDISDFRWLDDHQGDSLVMLKEKI
tara:strand:- start:2919 stop:3611 length:693 start_codon:yes stop_codon:yes gene_type:complete